MTHYLKFELNNQLGLVEESIIQYVKKDILNHTGNGLLSGNHKKDNVKRLSLHIKKRK